MIALYPWQVQQAEAFKQAAIANKLSHAFMFVGAKGVGKLQLAQYLTAYLLCEVPASAPCGQCSACHWFTQGTHPDYYHLHLLEKSAVIKVAQIRQLIDSLNQTAQQGGYQVAIVEDADKMNSAASNALLKTLEEPAGQVVIILLASSTAGLPATILSRVQNLYCDASPEKALPWLAEQHPDVSTLAVLLSLAHGAPLQVAELIKADILALRDNVLKDLYYLFAAKKTPVTIAAVWAKQPVKQLIDLLIFCFSDVLKLQQGASAAVCNTDALKALTYFSTSLSADAIKAYLVQLFSAKEKLSHGIKLNEQLLLEHLLIYFLFDG